MTRNRKVAIMLLSVALSFSCLCFMLSTIVVSSLASYGASYWMLIQYATGTNLWAEDTSERVEYLRDNCEMKPPARRGKSHAKPRVAEYLGYEGTKDE